MRPEAALDPALIVLENGGATALAERTLNQMLQGFGARPTTVVWRLDSITVTTSEPGHESTLVRRVAPVSMNVGRASEAVSLADRFAGGGLSPAALPAEIERIRRLPGPNPWLLSLDAAVAGAAFSQAAAGDHGSLFVAAIAACIGQLVRAQLQSWKLTRGVTTVTCTLVAALIGTAGLRLGFSATVAPTLLGSVMYAVPGLLLINGYLDFTSEKFLFIGAQRLLHAAFLFLLMTLAVLCADALL
jgi:uncharacterized membrane protein YjjP (DUF1212 family)